MAPTHLIPSSCLRFLKIKQLSNEDKVLGLGAWGGVGALTTFPCIWQGPFPAMPNSEEYCLYLSLWEHTLELAGALSM